MLLKDLYLFGNGVNLFFVVGEGGKKCTKMIIIAVSCLKIKVDEKERSRSFFFFFYLLLSFVFVIYLLSV